MVRQSTYPALYEGYLGRIILPTFENLSLDEAADEETFESWYNKLDPRYPTRMCT